MKCLKLVQFARRLALAMVTGAMLGGFVSAGAAAQALTKVEGDMPCPAGYSLVSPIEARASQDELCALLGTWDIVRLARGGSMDGPGYGCGIRDDDSRSLGHSVCKAPVGFVAGVGDGMCPEGTQVVTPRVARAHTAETCAALDQWDIARLTNGGSMDGPGYGCSIRNSDSRDLGHTLCAEYDFVRVTGDSPCPAGHRFLGPERARDLGDAACGLLGTWDIVRLAEGGSMDGPGYGCGVRNFDERELGHSLCIAP